MGENGKMSIDTVIKQADGMIASDMDGETVMMSVENGKYYSLGATGSCIWKMLDKPRRVSEIIELLLEQFDVEQETCEKQVFEFLREVYDEGIIEVSTTVV